MGLVERVTYQNAENGFCVIRVKARSHRDLVTVVGHAATIAAGEWITASGDWVNDRTHGQQFKARFLKTSEPTSVEGIEKYLASGMIRGIGPTYAKKLLRAFGEKVFEVIETQADRLREVNGIGPVRAARNFLGQCVDGRLPKGVQHRDGPARGFSRRWIIQLDNGTRAQSSRRVFGDGQKISKPTAAEYHPIQEWWWLSRRKISADRQAGSTAQLATGRRGNRASLLQRGN